MTEIYMEFQRDTGISNIKRKLTEPIFKKDMKDIQAYIAWIEIKYLELSLLMNN